MSRTTPLTRETLDTVLYETSLAARRAPRVLDTSEARQGLRALARTIVEARRRDREPCLYPAQDRDFIQLDHYIEIFLQKLKDDFMSVELNELLGPSALYGGHYGGPPPAGSTLEAFKPSETGFMALEDTVSSRLQIDLLPT